MKEKGRYVTILPEVKDLGNAWKVLGSERKRTPMSTGGYRRKECRGREAGHRISWDMTCASEVTAPRPISPGFTDLLHSLPIDSPLIFELEVTYRLLRDSTVIPSPPTNTLPPSFHSVIPHSKKLPQSLYNAGKNGSSWEHVTAQPEIKHRIKNIAELIAPAFRYNTEMLENNLLSCFQDCIDSEYPLFYPLWDRILHTFEALFSLSPCPPIDPSLHSLLSTLPSVLTRTHSPWIDRVSELTQSLRIVLLKLTDKQQARAIEQLWAYLIAVTCQNFPNCKPEIRSENRENTMNFVREKSEKTGLIALQVKIRNLEEENNRLKASNLRLQADAEHYMSLIKDRETELRQLHTVSNAREIDRFSQELMEYLTDAEGRQIANMETLESISQLINHKWTAGNKRSSRKNSRPTTRGLSPSSLSTKIPTEAPPNAPSKRPSGLQVFFPHSGHKRAGSPLSAVEPRREDWMDKLIEPQENVGKSPISPEKKVIEIVQIEQNQPTSKVNSQIENPRNPENSQKKSPELPKISETALNPANEIPQNLVVNEEAEESESDEEVPIFVDFSTQTDLSMNGNSQFPSDLTHLSSPARKKKENLLLLQLEKLERKQPPMPFKSIFKLFESAMDEKNKSDNLELESNQLPRNMTEFMLDFLYMQYGLKSLTLKNLSSFINALEILSRDKHPYGTLFCRLLEVFTDEPIDDVLAAFLVKARSAFNDLLQKWKGNLPKVISDDGGKLPLIDVADLIFVLFIADREVGESVLSRLIPESVSDMERAGLLLCGKLAKTGRDLKYFYVQIDVEKTGCVKYGAFEKGVREGCEVTVSKQQVQALWTSLNTESLSYQQLSKLPFKELSGRAQGKELMISKSDFMTEIAREYTKIREKEREDLTKLFLVFAGEEGKALSLVEFRALLTALNASIPESQQVSLFREALDHTENPSNLDSLDPAAFCHIAIKHRLGNAGKTLFDVDIRLLSDRLKDQFVHYEHEQGNMAVATNKFVTGMRRPQPVVTKP